MCRAGERCRARGGAAIAVALVAGLVAGPAAAAPRTLLRGATVLTMDPAVGSGPLGLLAEADVLFEETILAVGPNLPAAGAEVIEARGMIVLPGLVDAHNHLWQSLIRGCAPDAAVQEWINRCVIPGFLLTEDEVYDGVRLSAADLLNGGVTTTVDWSHSFTPAFVAGNLRALRDAGLRYVYAYFLYLPAAQEPDLRRRKATVFDVEPLATLQLAAHPSAKDQLALTRAAALARELGVALNVHLLESAADRGERPLALLQAADAFAVPLIVNHGVHVDAADLTLLAAQRVAATYNPLSNMRLASGVMPVGAYRARGIPLGIGLDGGANDGSDLFATLRAAVGLQRAASGRPDAAPGIAEALRMATLGGAEALGLAQRIGSLTPGKQADVILVDPRRINVAPVSDVAAQLVLNAQPANVTAVFVAGQARKRDGRLVLSGTSEADLVAAAQAAMAAWRSRTIPPLAPSAEIGALQQVFGVAP